MAERIAKIILLIEDSNQENLIRHFLKKCGHDNRTMRSVRLPPGHGSGEQFVRENYAREVRAIRATHTKACLIAMIDADTGSVEDRRQQFERALKDADQSPRGASDAILHLIPKRNVETWILCLNSHAVEELSDYRRDPRVDAQAIKSAAGMLFSWTRANFVIPSFCVPSLRGCSSEFQRIPGEG
jgi:hypothetical protein